MPVGSTMNVSIHEDFSNRHKLQISTDRSFGIVFTVFFLLLGIWPLRKGGPVRWSSVGLAVAFAAIVLVRPALLHPLNLAWAKLSLLLAKVVNPIVMGLLFFVAITPVALILRLLGKDPLRLRFDPAAGSYWLHRQPPGPAPETMSNQF
jgi:hypothetical protein